MSSRNHNPGGAARRLAVLATFLVLPLGGCVANSSNPSVLIRSARSDERGASFELELDNPGGRSLIVNRLDYEVGHGESAFPVATGSWKGELPLPARGHATLVLETPFDTAPIEPESQLLHLNGELLFVDQTGYMGLKSMDLTKTPFHDTVDAARSSP